MCIIGVRVDLGSNKMCEKELIRCNLSSICSFSKPIECKSKNLLRLETGTYNNYKIATCYIMRNYFLLGTR